MCSLSLGKDGAVGVFAMSADMLVTSGERVETMGRQRDDLGG